MKIIKKIYGTVLAVLCLCIIPKFANAVVYFNNVGNQINNSDGNYTNYIDTTTMKFENILNNTEVGNGYYAIQDSRGHGESYFYIGYYTGKMYSIGRYNRSSCSSNIVQGFADIYECSPNRTDTNYRQIFDSACTKTTDYDYDLFKNGISNATKYGIGDMGIGSCYAGTVCREQNSKIYCLVADTSTSLGLTLNDIEDTETMDTFFNRSGGGGENTPGTPVINVSCPTIQQLINSYQEQYQPSLCYSSEKIWSGNGFVTLTPKTIFELYPQYTGFEQDINTYYNYCNNSISTTTTCQQAFAGKEEQYTLISKIPNNVNDVKLYEYCHLQLDYEDKNATTCTTTGVTNETIPIENIVDEIIKSDRGITLPGGTQQDGSGNITGNSIFTDIMDGENINISNVIDSLQSVYNKLTGIFYRRNGVDGIIPDIIVRALLLVVLFKIFKK